jgi:branched-chain amino acid aminotransferase
MAITAPRMWLDGEMITAAEADLPLMAHATQRGSLVFDVGSFHATARGPALFRAREHVARFLRSARIVGLELDARHDETALVEAARAVVAATGKEHGLIRWSAFFAASEPDLLPRSSRAKVAVAAQLFEDPPRLAPLRIATFPDARKAAPEALDPAVKASAAYLGPMLARRRAVASGADEIVLLDRDGFIAEAPTANAFAVASGALWTPPLRYVLAGITRDAVLTLAREEGIPIREEPLPLEVFASADEAFLSATSFPIAPIGSVDGRAKAAPGPMTTRLSERLARIQSGTEASHHAWVMLAR